LASLGEVCSTVNRSHVCCRKGKRGRARREGQQKRGQKGRARREGLDGKGKKGSREGTLNEKGVYKYVQSDVLAC